jgi:4-amino-4-deoxy-L-arabinose transferase-like glycosyltransferase
VLPHRNGELPSKPPLYHWIAASLASLFGISDAIVRMPSALAATVMAVATFVLGRAIGGRTTAWLAVGALLGMQGFWQSAWEARVDMVFAACVAVALVAFFFWYRDRGAGARALCYAAAGGAVLTKGPAGAVLPGVVIVAFLVREHWTPPPWARRVRGGVAARATPSAPERATTSGATASESLAAVFARLWSWPLVIAVLAVDLGWYALAYRAGGDEFVAVQLVRENADRFLGRGIFGEHGGRPLFDMAVQLATDLLPWSLVLVWAALRWLRGEREDQAGRFLHVWWIVILGFFTIAVGKRSIYLLPLYPALALLAGRALAASVARAPATRLLGVVPVPARIRRAFPAAPARALLTIAVLAFDLVLVGASQAVRLQRARERSLLPFAAEVERTITADDALYAAHGLSPSDLQVLAYRLHRSIPRAPRAPGEAPVYCLVRAADTPAFERADFATVAVSARRGVDVALLRAPPHRSCVAHPALVGGAEREH